MTGLRYSANEQLLRCNTQIGELGAPHSARVPSAALQAAPNSSAKMHHRRAHAGHDQLAPPISVQTEMRWLGGRLTSWMLKSYMERPRPRSPPDHFKSEQKQAQKHQRNKCPDKGSQGAGSEVCCKLCAARANPFRQLPPFSDTHGGQKRLQATAIGDMPPHGNGTTYELGKP
jgi:hypothetical protein